MRGLYLITNDDDFALLKDKIAVALKTGGIALLQYRRKKINVGEQLLEIDQIQNICQHYDVPLIINDNIALAAAFGCGLHLGQGDGSLLEARRQLGQHAIIGRTCHHSLGLAAQAANEGASYLAFGAVYTSATKPNATQVDLNTLAQAKQQFNLPICAIGGLSVENSQPVIEAGVDLLAVVGDIFNLPTEQIQARVNAWQQLFKI